MADQLALFGQPQQELTSDDWYTPRWIFDALGVTFDLDVACPPGGSPNTPCRRYYTQADDGLASPWEGLVWMNPPYSRPAPWVQKWVEHANGLALMVMTKSHWFESLWTHPETHVVYMRQIKFERPGIRGGSASSWSYGLWAIGDVATHALQRSNLGKVR